ncbi:putative Xaa-Pro aminopeptidase 3 [Trichinella murrelli]|uniref:Putative Xaa-Pro aminopeptidase 3 n=1 Tax=Trichinella murrelli TaxID=144512 RepID=A0A0V0TLB4_9BILA|nr:putative Xaa-Pro aminopeptidase 3 [Trichinella murrelli]
MKLYTILSRDVQATVLWAQRKNYIFLTVCVEDCKDPKVDITEDKFTFRGIGGTDKTPHHCEIEFYEKVDPNSVRRIISDRQLEFVINKLNNDGAFWPRLMKNKGRHWWCKVDFNKWRDEDDVSLDGDANQDFDFSKYAETMHDDKVNAEFGKFSDSDDEELPELGTDDATSIESHINLTLYMIRSLFIDLMMWNKLLNEARLSVCRMSRYVGQPSPVSHPQLIGVGCVTPGILKTEYAERRAKFWSSVWKHAQANNTNMNSCVVLIPAASVRFCAPDVPHVFRQESNFFYLCGFQEPDSLLLLYGKSEEAHRSVLFVQERNPHKELWEGTLAGCDGAKWLTDVDWATVHDDFTKFFEEYLLANGQARSTMMYSVVSDLSAANPCYKKALEIAKNLAIYGESALELIHRLRWIKSSAEVELMRKACSIGSEALAETMRYTRHCRNENVLVAKMDLELRLRGAKQLAYPPVVAGGPRANIIHYLDANQIIEENDLILMDVGCEVGGYVSDITRTWPVSGVFSKPQSILYDLLYDCQCKLIDGIAQRRLVTLREAYLEMMSLLRTELQNAGLLSDKLTAQQAFNAVDQICPHHVGHYLGLDVHDTHTVPKDIPFQTGVVITVEPGLYFPSDCVVVPEEFRGIGMRIEDDVLVTSAGVEICLISIDHFLIESIWLSVMNENMHRTEKNKKPLCSYCKKSIENNEAAFAFDRIYHRDHIICSSCKMHLNGGEMCELQDGKILCLNCDKKLKCEACELPLDLRTVYAMGKRWHQECFTCSVCGEPFLNWQYLIYNQKPYCVRHYPYRAASPKY